MCGRLFPSEQESSTWICSLFNAEVRGGPSVILCKYLSRCQVSNLMLRCYHASSGTHSPHSFMGAFEYIHISEAWLFLFSSHSIVLLRDSILLQTHRITYFCYFLPFNYRRQKRCTFEVELNITAVFFWCYWCYNNKSSSLSCYSATCCWQTQHWGKINNCVCNFTPSSHRKPSDSSAFFPPVLLDLCPRLCSTTAGFGPKTLQELMENPERIYRRCFLQVWTEQ